MRQKLLYLSQCFPLPTDGGGTIKTFNTIGSLAKKFDLYAVFISERDGTKVQKEVFKKMGVKIKVFKTYTMMESVKNNYWRLFWNYLLLRPHFVYQYRYIPGIRYIRKLIKKLSPDVIHVDHINSSQFLPNRLWLKRNLGYVPVLVLENHNLNHILFKTRFYETKKLIRKAYLLIEGTLNYLYGLVNYKRYDHIFSISDAETTYLKNFYNSVHTQPLVYPLSAGKSKKNRARKYEILFIGNLHWPPNEVGVLWFLKKIFPKIRKKIPGVRFHVVGKYNEKFDKYKNDETIVFYGYVDNIDTFILGAKVFILPFKTGAGVRIKSLTAMEAGLPIVSTGLGVEGLKARDRREYVHAETEAAFARGVTMLLTDRKLWKSISRRQKEYFSSNHSVQSNEIFLKKYLSLVKKTKV